MSQRGSFVTEYIYCAKCLAAAKSILGNREKYRCSQLPSHEAGRDLPVIAGGVGGLYEGEELHSFDFDYREQLEPLLCHPLRVAVLAEKGQEFFTFMPTGRG